MLCPSGLIELMAFGEKGRVLAGMAFRRGDIAEGTMAVFLVVPADEVQGPLPCGGKALEASGRIGRPVLAGSEQGLREGVVVAHAGAAVGGFNAECRQRRSEGAAFLRAAVVGMQHQGLAHTLFSEDRATNQLCGH